MNMIRKLFLFLFILFNLAGCKKEKDDLIYDRSYVKEIKKARQEIILYMGKNSIPGATWAVSKKSKIIYSEGLGLASRDLEVRVTRKTKFRIGQISENITALIYHKLVEEGVLHPDSTVNAYLPFFPEKNYPVPISHLVQQTSGIRVPDNEEKDFRGMNVSIQKGLEQFMNDSLIAPPGTIQLVSLYNYNLLGSVMEKTTGVPFHELLEKYISDTLGMANTTIDNPFATIIARSDFFDHNFVAQVMHATTRDMRYKAPSEGMLSNAEDLVIFGNALLKSEYVSDNIRKKLFEPFNLNNQTKAQMTNGWMLLQDFDNRMIYGRSGNVTGGSAAILIYPEEELVIACATNLTALSDDLPVFSIAGAFLTDSKKETEEKTQE